MSFFDEAGKFVQNQLDDIEERKQKFDRYSDAQLLDRYKKTAGKDKIAMLQLAKERGLL